MIRKPWFLALFVVIGYFLIVFPIVVVIGTSFTAGSAFAFPPSGLSMRWYKTFFGQPEMIHSFLNVSLVVGLLTSLFSVILGTLAAVCLVRTRFLGRAAVETLVALPMVVPHLLLGIALYLFFVRLDIGTSSMTLLVGHIIIATPYVTRNVAAGLVGLDPRLEEAAIGLGANPVTAFVKVSLPLIRSSLIAGGILAFIVSFGDINLALFLSGPGETSLPVHIFSNIQWGADPSIAAASVIQILVVGCTLLLVQRIFRVRVGA
jgi:putative spermidine/putrescine transport system permease protein